MGQLGRNHLLWALLAPLSIGVFLAIPQVVDIVGATARIVGYTAILIGGMGVLTTQVAMRDNDSPRVLRLFYNMAIALGIASFLTWIFAPLDQSPSGVALAAYASLAYAIVYGICGVLGFVAWLVAKSGN